MHVLHLECCPTTAAPMHAGTARRRGHIGRNPGKRGGGLQELDKTWDAAQGSAEAAAALERAPYLQVRPRSRALPAHIVVFAATARPTYILLAKHEAHHPDKR